MPNCIKVLMRPFNLILFFICIPRSRLFSGLNPNKSSSGFPRKNSSSGLSRINLFSGLTRISFSSGIPRKTFGFPGSLRSSNGRRVGCSSKLGSRFSDHLTLPFAHIIPYSMTLCYNLICRIWGCFAGMSLQDEMNRAAVHSANRMKPRRAVGKKTFR